MRTLILSMLLLATACVPRGRHEVVAVQLEATRLALSEQEAACRASLRERERDVADLQGDLRGCQTDQDDLLERLEAQAVTLGELESALATWLEALPRQWVQTVAEDPPADEFALSPDRPVPLPPEMEALLEAEVPALAEALRLQRELAVQRMRRLRRHEEIERRFAPLVEGGFAEVLLIDDASVVRIPAGKLFAERPNTLTPRGEAIMADSAAALEELGRYDLEVRGHTDATPHHSAEHPSNWELAFDRAMVVVRALEAQGLSLPVHATSFAGRDPLVPGTDAEARDRDARVELWLRPRTQAEEPAEEAPDEG